MDDSLSDIFYETEFTDTSFTGGASPDDLFSIFDSLEVEGAPEFAPLTPLGETVLRPKGGSTGGSSCEDSTRLVSQKPTSSSTAQQQDTDTGVEASPPSKRPKLSSATAIASSDEPPQDGQQRMSHITVERNRRKQMNEHLSVLRSLMPCFYVKRGDQASIIGGVVDYIKELQQVLQSLEAKKQRKAYSEVLSPRLVSSPRPSPLSPRKPPLSPRLSLPPISPRTPQPGSPYKPRTSSQQGYPSPTQLAAATSHESSLSTCSSFDSSAKELWANSKSAIADVEVKLSGSNVLLKTISPRIPGQALKIVATLESLPLEILHVSISTVDDTMLNSFTIKIGIECELSAEELAHEIQQTFC
ncbi:PREDICTED: transcription factor SPEECHLESS-like [Nelumbo nucifera]|uniref:BHLH domain-containing protein n=2 Tax=Nelumbo nucifera TaxID=4432 RepID=A0A822YUX6_NELNU|nr:PREDICTED: transcription factor SPEECHLESS-like [Nelumbo nucifera]DAD36320.1 TPA_asm: hypothetical protein HUJ06_006961 [Nelumbo nucifera]